MLGPTAYGQAELQALQLIHSPTWIMDCDTFKCVWGNEASRLLWQVESMLEVDWSEASIQTRQRIKSKLITLLEGSSPANSWEIFPVFPKGSPIILNCNFSPVKVALEHTNPNKFYLLMNCYNMRQNQIKEQARAMEVLNYSESHFSLYTRDGKSTLFINAAAKTRRALEESFQDHFYDHFEELEREERVEKILRKIDQTRWGEVLDEFVIKRDFSSESIKNYSLANDNDEKWWRVVIKKVRDVSGDPTILVQEEDITELKRIQKKLEIANTTKNSFLANMSHELRTPVNGIISIQNYLLKGTKLNFNQKYCIKTAQSSCENLLILLNDILEFSKINANQLRIENEEFSVKGAIELVEEVCDLLSFNVKENVILYSICNPLLINSNRKFSVDSSRIRQIIINIVGNAIKFTSNGSIEVNIDFVLNPKRNQNNIIEYVPDVVEVKPKEYHLQVIVKDTGIGVKEDKIDDIFEEFVQGDSSTTRKYGGTGLGLSISRKLARLMSGDVFLVESQLNIGSTFVFHIPTGIFENDNDLFHPIGSISVQNVSIISSHHSDIVILNLLKQYFDSFNLNINLNIVNDVNDLKEFEEHLVILVTPEKHVDDSFVQSILKYRENHQNCIIVTLSPFKRDNPVYKFSHQIFNLPLKILHFHQYVQKISFGDSIDIKEEIVEEDDDGDTKALMKTIKSRLSEAGGCKILLADDHNVNRMIIAKNLERFGITPLIAKDGAEAFAIFKENIDNIDYIDIILMDLFMPEINGAEVTKLIREEEAKLLTSLSIHRHTYIVGITADDTKKDLCLAAGMDSFLTKPLVNTSFLQLIGNWLDCI